jgi:hypothetical protein
MVNVAAMFLQFRVADVMLSIFQMGASAISSARSTHFRAAAEPPAETLQENMLLFQFVRNII